MIRTYPIARATIELFPSDVGGLKSPLPSGTRSLMLVFPDAQPANLMLGAAIELDGEGALGPGASGLSVSLTFWDEEAMDVLRPGAAFKIWHGRIVGRGAIEELTGTWSHESPPSPRTSPSGGDGDDEAFVERF